MQRNYSQTPNPSVEWSDFAYIAFATGPRALKGAFLRVVETSWTNRTVDLLLAAEDPDDKPFLNSLRTPGTEVYVACGTDVALCRVTGEPKYQFTSEGRTERWRIQFAIETSDFTPSTELSFSSTSADQIAEMRTRRLLLNQYPPPTDDDRDWRNLKGINELTHEVFLRGQGTRLAILGSPFPALYKQYGGHTTRFLHFAWIMSAFLLKLSACVAQVDYFKLTLQEDNTLYVDFAGKRKKEYSNVPPFSVVVRGTCPLR